MNSETNLHNSEDRTENVEHANLQPIPQVPAPVVIQTVELTPEQLKAQAHSDSAGWRVIDRPAKLKQLGRSENGLAARLRAAELELDAVYDRVTAMPPAGEGEPFTPLHDLRENTRLLQAALADISSVKQKVAAMPQVLLSTHDKDVDGAITEPRIFTVAAGYFAATGGQWSTESFAAYLGEVEIVDSLELEEHWSLPSALKFALLEQTLTVATATLSTGNPVESSTRTPLLEQIRGLRELGQVDWPKIIEPLIPTESVLRKDPSGDYAKQDFETREAYRKKVAHYARYSDVREIEVATAALDLARASSRQAEQNERVYRRRSHVGYYLVDKGALQLTRRIGYHPPLIDRVRLLLRNNPDDFYIGGIEILSILVIVAALVPLVPSYTFMGGVLLAFALLLLPATQGAIDLINNVVTSLFEAQALPKLDLTEGITPQFATLVAVPTLLLNPAQLQDLVDELEVRFLANQDPNLHFALVTDLPDSVSRPREMDKDPIVDAAIEHIDRLNARYAHLQKGGFILLHRHRLFNARQGVWMGWERKRGKLTDLNRLLKGVYDSFPVKAGRLDVLNAIKFVITLDSDTQLPRGTAQSMIGALAHPLNQAIVDPHRRVVIDGYGILQPRIGVSVSSVARSRLASIYSGQAGFDPYTRAVSDVYQDMYGEGIFTGKGIYDVEALHAVLDKRFPRNALLSHDLIEGAYARAGLITDVELIDDYPSHYSAFTRRKHRWVRGDWQIAQWIFGKVPNESGKLERNPISTVSRWKILDNLRRSLVELFTFILLVAGWMGLPGGPLYWTVTTLLLIFLPTFVQMAFSLGRAFPRWNVGTFKTVLGVWSQSAVITFLNFVFLPHQALLSIDAIVRALVRRFVTGEKLLEWETAAEAEKNRTRRTPVDMYLALSPFLAIGLAIMVSVSSLHALWVAAPILVLWGFAGPVTAWLDRIPADDRRALTDEEDKFLRRQAVLIWRYFREYGDKSHHYLIPDNVEEGGKEAARVSPTNLGLLLNARQAAVEFGFLTVPEFVQLTRSSFDSIAKMEKHRGHLFNWYSTHTLEPLRPASVSTVDSGNLAASLYVLSNGTRTLLKKPLLSRALMDGIVLMHNLSTGGRETLTLAPDASLSEWIPWVTSASENIATEPVALTTAVDPVTEAAWWKRELAIRASGVRNVVHDYMPWLLPEFASLRTAPQLGFTEQTEHLSAEEALKFARQLDIGLNREWVTGEGGVQGLLTEQLRTRVAVALKNLENLIRAVDQLAEESFRLAWDMDFQFLFRKERQLLSIGYDVEKDEVHAACYDLLASEARTASYLAVSAGHIPQQSWFRLDRTHTVAFNQVSLLSWTGTMFEYLMPALWMRTYPETLLSRALANVVKVQQAFARHNKIPWGISECGHATRDEAGHYGYHAFGVPDVAIKFDADAGPVVSPYSTILALNVDMSGGLKNLRQMAAAGWMGAYGFYESVDYTGGDGRSPVIVREWMAHHQGMSMMALMNFLYGNAAQGWFHGNPHLRANELLLHEKPIDESGPRAAAKSKAGKPLRGMRKKTGDQSTADSLKQAS